MPPVMRFEKKSILPRVHSGRVKRSDFLRPGLRSSHSGIGERYHFGLDEAGASDWNRIAQPRPVIEIRDALLEQYDAEAEQCGWELIELLDALHERGADTGRRRAHRG